MHKNWAGRMQMHMLRGKEKKKTAPERSAGELTMISLKKLKRGQLTMPGIRE
jgi:hypothetical protein